jgi:hypothetical protein
MSTKLKRASLPPAQAVPFSQLSAKDVASKYKYELILTLVAVVTRYVVATVASPRLNCSRCRRDVASVALASWVSRGTSCRLARSRCYVSVPGVLL